MDPQAILSRIARCLLLDADAYEEVRSSSADTLSAMLIVIFASYAAGLGGLIWTFVSADYVDHLRFFVRSLLLGGGIQVLVFLLWVAVTGLILEHTFRIPVRFAELLRVMGFAFAPVGLQLLIFIPAVDQPIGIIALACLLYVSTYAVQASTIASAGQAFAANLLGFGLFCLILGILGNGAADLAPGLFALDPNSLSVGLTLPFTTTPR